MASYTALLKLTQPDLGATGWGTTVNSGVTALVEQAVAGAISVDITTGTSTLSAIASGASSDARNQFIILTASPSRTSPSTLTVPAAPGATSSKLYFIKNSSGDAVTVETSGGTSVSVPNGKSMMLKVTTAGVEEAMTHAASLTLDTALAATSGGTGQSSYAVGDLLYADTTTSLAKLAAVAEGSVLRSKGTGTAPAWEQVDLTTDVTDVLPPANGGTGLSDPGASGNVLRSDGAGAWTSSALSSATDTTEGLVELATTAEVQTGTDTTRAITPAGLRGGALVLDTLQTVSAVAQVDFTSIPAWVKRITIMFSGVSTNGTNFIDIQIGDAGGLETTGYVGTQSNIIGGGTGANNYGGDAFELRYVGTPYLVTGTFTLTLMNAATNLWVGTGVHGADTGIATTFFSAGRKALSDTLDRLCISAGGNSITGSFNIMYE